MSALVGILMGSDSDLPVMKDAAQVLEVFQLPYELTVISAHRNPEKVFQYAKSAGERRLKVIIAGAGGAAHLAGVIAANTVLPVIGVPIKGSSLSGLDSLLSIVQMPGGVPVATVGINGAKNAGLLAVQMLALADKALQEKLAAYKVAMTEKVDKIAAEVERLGYQEYLQKRGN